MDIQKPIPLAGSVKEIRGKMKDGNLLDKFDVISLAGAINKYQNSEGGINMSLLTEFQADINDDVCFAIPKVPMTEEEIAEDITSLGVATGPVLIIPVEEGGDINVVSRDGSRKKIKAPNPEFDNLSFSDQELSILEGFEMELKATSAAHNASRINDTITRISEFKSSLDIVEGTINSEGVIVEADGRIIDEMIPDDAPSAQFIIQPVIEDEESEIYDVEYNYDAPAIGAMTAHRVRIDVTEPEQEVSDSTVTIDPSGDFIMTDSPEMMYYIESSTPCIVTMIVVKESGVYASIWKIYTNSIDAVPIAEGKEAIEVLFENVFSMKNNVTGESLTVAGYEPKYNIDVSALHMLRPFAIFDMDSFVDEGYGDYDEDYDDDE